MTSVERCELPELSLLSTYRDTGAYTDCYVTDIGKPVSQAEFVRAFYTTSLFKIERAILKLVVSKQSTDDGAGLLADSRLDSFAAWNVEARRDNQILLADFRGRTRSWLMSTPTSGTESGSTRLYFGSAVVPLRADDAEEPRVSMAFRILLPFHKLYSRALLSSAKTLLSQ